MSRHRLPPHVYLAICFLGLVTGCSTLNVNKPTLPWSKTAEKNYETPERIIAVWSDTVYQHPGKPPTRGFGGRIYFYNREGKVIPVNGELVVYAYDDTSANVAYDKPTRKYAFTADQLTRYYSESDLGASYNVWIPWDAVGNNEKQINLFPVFKDDSGRLVRGTFASNRLPGKRNLTEEERRGFYVSPNQNRRQPTAENGNGNVQQVQFQTPVADATADTTRRESGLRTTTIRVPRSLSQRMAQAPPLVLPTPRYQPPWTTDPAVQNRPSNDLTIGNTNTNNDFMAPTSNLLQNAGIPTQNQRAPTGSSSYPPVNQLPPNGTNIVTVPIGQQGFSGVDPQSSVSANSRAWARQDQRSAHFEPPRFRVPTTPGAQQHRERGLIQQSPLTPQYGLPSTR